MASLDLHFWRILAPKIDERLKDQIDQIVSAGAQTFEDYKYRCGYIQATKDILADAEEAFRQMSEPERRKSE